MTSRSRVAVFRQQDVSFFSFRSPQEMTGLGGRGVWACEGTAVRVRVRGVCDGSCLGTRGEQSCRLVAEHARSSTRITEGRGNANAEDG